jgi:type IV pilus assembly protein PilQ
MHYETRRIGPSRNEEEHARWTGRPIDLDVKDADIRDLLRLLSEVGHANIVVADGVSGRVTIRMKHVPWDQALDVVARAKGLAIERDGGVMLVTHP